MATKTSLKLGRWHLCRQLLACHANRQMSTAESTFKFSDLEIELTTDRRPRPDADKLLFGHNFSDHMLQVWWHQKTGWGKPRITPLQNLSLHPAAKVLHYAPELFEGLKAYRGADDCIRLFRPEENVKRMLLSAARSALPTFDGEELVKCMKRLIDVDRDWVPHSKTSTLYIRPTMIGTEPTLGVSISTECLLFVLTGPVGPYYPTGFCPVSLMADPKYVRACEGGVGMYKMGANYAPTILVQAEALNKHGCQQVLWLYGPDHQLTEVGTMNLFMYWLNEHGENELITPPIDKGIILPGITRKSLLELARQWGEFKVSERTFTISQVIRGLQEGRIKEMFGSGTACVVSPIERIVYQGEPFEVPTMSEGAPLVNRFYDTLSQIQYGTIASDWTTNIDDL